MVKIPEGEFWILHNFFTGFTATLNYFQKIYFENAPEIYDGQENLKELLDKGFLVDYDEMRHLKSMAISGDVLGSIRVTICPTLDCNFECPYCFENKRKGKMSRETQDQVIESLKNAIDLAKAGSLHITWYGGEPTLYPDVLEYMSKAFIDMCSERHIDYSARIITNGHLLSQQMTDLFSRCSISSIQVTLDGPMAEIHDATRHLKSGRGSYDSIIENLQTIRTDARINVRCNVTKNNASRYKELSNLIDTIREKTGNNIYSYPDRMRCSDSMELDDLYSVQQTELSYEEFSDLKAETNPVYQKTPLRYRRIYCGAQTNNSIVVDELGNLYKCWEDMGKDQHVFGHIKDLIPIMSGKKTDHKIKALDNYLGTIWPEDDKECMSCVLLPVCAGGCPRQRFSGQRPCIYEKFNLDKCVLKIYNQSISHMKGDSYE